ncbi:hypothetical protein DPMN_140966 [Dreissena polymorpha]|uniref:Uncharacterized protein n=1 Tax=Dreissena polymorpha TaxID=45954 RepID=A0A9D4GBT8_DREPO|nr:hypothetical protein DPMN_140966 [Dreissena polymorpha]
MDLCDNRRELRHRKHTSNVSRTENQKSKKELRKEMNEEKFECIEEKCINIDTEMTTCSS